LRRYIGTVREENLLANLKARLSTLKSCGLEVLSLEPHPKDGGVFVKFRYNTEGRESTLSALESDLRQHIEKRGGLPSWLAWPRGNIWLVKGRPWREVFDQADSWTALDLQDRTWIVSLPLWSTLCSKAWK
jgi:hypothetical protein